MLDTEISLLHAHTSRVRTTRICACIHGRAIECMVGRKPRARARAHTRILDMLRDVTKERMKATKSRRRARVCYARQKITTLAAFSRD